MGITNKEELNLRERLASAGRIEQLQRQLFPTPLDYEALKEIHRVIFQDIYDWAGKPRTIGITKSETLLSGNSVEYPHPHHPQAAMNMTARTEYAFKQLKKDKYLKDIPSLIFTGKLTKHITEIWENHVFPDGNTRTISVFAAYLIYQSGHRSRGMFIGESKHFRDALVRSTAGDRSFLKNYFDEKISLQEKLLPRGYDKDRGYDISDDR